MNILFTWLVFMLLFLALGYILGARRRTAARREDESSENQPIGAEMLASFQQRVMPVLAVAGYQVRDGGVLFDGKLRTDPRSALSQLTRAFAPDKLTPILREGEGRGQVRVAVVRAMPSGTIAIDGPKQCDRKNQSAMTTTKKETKSMTKDPICGMTVDEASALHAERDGKTFYFCSDHCRQKFLSTTAGANPEEKPGGCCG